MDTTARVEAKKTELLETFAGLSDKQLKVASDLIAQAAFMAVTLEDLAASISENGTVEEYTNGANQSGRKISSDAKLYASLIAKYTQIVTKLLKIVPKERAGRIQPALPMPSQERYNKDRLIEKLLNDDEAEREYNVALAGALRSNPTLDMKRFREEWERKHTV